MKRIVIGLLALLVIGTAAAAQTASVAHIDVMRIWRQASGTPNGMGYLPLAEEEARIALLHANKALDAQGNQVQVNIHLGHLVHALNPGREAEGPGRGYGLTRAAVNILAQMQAASSRPDASAFVRETARFVMPAADHVAQLSQEARLLADEMRNNPGQPAEKLTIIRNHIAAAINGRDDDGDGKLSPTESGLRQIREQMADLMQAEGF